MISETEFFTKIIEKYSDINQDPIKIELLKSNAIRELMEVHSNKGKQDFIQNAMPIILSLFREECVDPFDACSKDIEKLSSNEKQKVTKILKEIN
ncbi:MAG: hypothetical protein ACQERB_15295 [Promethearchaeati archaeon]